MQYGARPLKYTEPHIHTNMSNKSIAYTIRTFNLETGATENIQYSQLNEAMEIFQAYCAAFSIDKYDTDGHNYIAMNKQRCITLRTIEITN